MDEKWRLRESNSAPTREPLAQPVDRTNQRLSEIVRYGEGESQQVDEKSLTPPVRDFIREYIARGTNLNWISDCINGQRLCTDLLGQLKFI